MVSCSSSLTILFSIYDNNNYEYCSKHCHSHLLAIEFCDSYTKKLRWKKWKYNFWPNSLFYLDKSSSFLLMFAQLWFGYFQEPCSEENFNTENFSAEFVVVYSYLSLFYCYMRFLWTRKYPAIANRPPDSSNHPLACMCKWNFGGLVVNSVMVTVWSIICYTDSIYWDRYKVCVYLH